MWDEGQEYYFKEWLMVSGNRPYMYPLSCFKLGSSLCFNGSCLVWLVACGLQSHLQRSLIRENTKFQAYN